MTRLRAGLAAGAAVLLLAGCSTQLVTSADLADVDGSVGVTGTGKFDATGAWDLNYSFDCTRQQAEGKVGANGFTLTVYNADDQSTAFEHPQLTLNRKSGRGVLHFQRSGPYDAEVDSLCSWHILVRDRNSA